MKLNYLASTVSGSFDSSLMPNSSLEEEIIMYSPCTSSVILLCRASAIKWEALGTESAFIYKKWQRQKI